MMLITTISCLLLGTAGTLHGSAGDDTLVSVELPAVSTSEGLDINVSEVATVTGADASLVERVKRASLGYAPAPGFHRTLRADLVEASLRQSLPGVKVEVSGAPRCRVTPAVVLLAGADLQAEAAVAMRAALAGQDAEATPTGSVPDVQVPQSETEPRIVVPKFPGSTFPGVRSVPVQIWVGQNLYRTVNVPFQVSIWQRRAVLKRAVNQGEALHAGLFDVQRVAVDTAQGMQALSLTELGGAVALNPLAAGVSVSERDVHRQVVVRRGDHVTVCVMKGAVKVSDVAIAQADGRLGERVRVTLRSTGRELIATVRGAQAVEVRIQ